MGRDGALVVVAVFGDGVSDLCDQFLHLQVFVVEQGWFLIYCHQTTIKIPLYAGLVAKGSRQRLGATLVRRLHAQSTSTTTSAIVGVVVDGRRLADDRAGSVLLGGKVLFDFVRPFDAVTGQVAVDGRALLRAHWLIVVLVVVVVYADSVLHIIV